MSLDFGRRRGDELRSECRARAHRARCAARVADGAWARARHAPRRCANRGARTWPISSPDGRSREERNGAATVRCRSRSDRADGCRCSRPSGGDSSASERRNPAGMEHPGSRWRLRDRGVSGRNATAARDRAACLQGSCARREPHAHLRRSLDGRRSFARPWRRGIACRRLRCHALRHRGRGLSARRVPVTARVRAGDCGTRRVDLVSDDLTVSSTNSSELQNAPIVRTGGIAMGTSVKRLVDISRLRVRSARRTASGRPSDRRGAPRYLLVYRAGSDIA